LDGHTVYIFYGYAAISSISSSTIANYINMLPVQRYLVAMSADACQKNISQPIIANLPISSILLKPRNHCESFF